MSQSAPSQKGAIVHLDTLQSMLNAILLEIGKALPASGKAAEATIASSKDKLHATIPIIGSKFHSALDELECDILRAKAVLGRDLGELQARRLALEAPPQTEAMEVDLSSILEIPQPSPIAPVVKEENKPIKEEESSKANKPPTFSEEKPAHTPPKDPTEAPNPSSPLKSETQNVPIGLGISTLPDAPSVSPSNPADDASIDALFNEDATLDFDIDFSIPEPSSTAQPKDETPSQTLDFDLSTFGADVAQDFGLADLQAPKTANATNETTTSAQPDAGNDVFNTGGDAGAGASMAMDLGLGGSADSAFDDIWFGEDDKDLNAGGIEELEHGEFDNAFFGIED